MSDASSARILLGVDVTMSNHTITFLLGALLLSAAAGAAEVQKSTGRVGAILYGAEEGVASFQLGADGYSIGGLYCGQQSAQWVRVVTLAKQNHWRVEVSWLQSSVPPGKSLPPIRCVTAVEAL